MPGASAGGTLARDVVHYAVPLDFLVHRWLVQPDIEKIFAFRTQELRKRFSTQQD
jgi:ligand-binding SRPBCC domain-containing protein